MSKPVLAFAAISAALALTTIPREALATDSLQGPMYVQGGVGISFWDFPSLGTAFGVSTAYSWAGFSPSAEFGYHVLTGRHDGLSVGVRQAFSINAVQGRSAGMTSLRAGYDFAFEGGKVELNLDPFVTLGLGYVFDGLALGGPSAGLNGSVGADGKLFFGKGFYVFARPVEVGFQCFHDVGLCAFSYQAAVGAGFSFGGK